MWLLTTFAGNVIDMLISGSHIIHEPALEFFFYAFLMFIVVGIFILIAVNYKYVDEEALETEVRDSRYFINLIWMFSRLKPKRMPFRA